jgi:hypothetical protein
MDAKQELAEATVNFAKAVERTLTYGTTVSVNGHDGLWRAEKRLLAALERFRDENC